MTKQQTISAILKQDNYKVSDGKVLRYDQLDEKFKPVIVSGNRIPLVKTGQIVEIFAWDDVAACIEGLSGAAMKNDVVDDLDWIKGDTIPFTPNGKVTVHTLTIEPNKKVKPKKQIMAKKKKAETKTKSNRKPSVNLTDEHIAIIKKEHNKGTSKMAIARLLSEKTGMDVTRFIVMYHVKKIDAKKK